MKPFLETFVYFGFMPWVLGTLVFWVPIIFFAMMKDLILWVDKL